MDAKPTQKYTDPSDLLNEMQAVAFHPDIPGQVTSRTTEVMSHIALAMIAVELKRIEMHLGNIHQALITPNAEREPVTVADQLKRIANALYIEMRGEQIQIADVLLDIRETLDERNDKDAK